MSKLEFLKNDAALDLRPESIHKLRRQIKAMTGIEGLMAQISLDMEVALEYGSPDFDDHEQAQENLYVEY